MGAVKAVYFELHSSIDILIYTVLKLPVGNNVIDYKQTEYGNGMYCGQLKLDILEQGRSGQSHSSNPTFDEYLTAAVSSRRY